MLTDQVVQLITAFVDGELSQRQRKAITRLLHRSSEARELLRQLQENAHKIKQLPRHKVEPSLVDEVLQAVADQKSHPMQPMAPRSRRRRWMPYVAASLAASLLIGAMGILYWQSMNELDDGKIDSGNFAKIVPEKKVEPQPTPMPRKTNPMLAHLVEGTFRDFAAPVQLEQAFTANFRDFQQNGTKTGQFAHEVNRAQAVQLDITVKSNSIAMERLKSTLHSYKIAVLEDPSAVKALKDNKQAKVEYLVFAENLTTDELARMMKDLGQPDTSGMQGSVPSPYDKVTVTPITPNETRKIAGLLGIEPNMLDIPKNGNNTKPTPEKDWQRKVVVLPVSAGAQPSEQVRQFVNQRRPQAGAVQLLIKIRQD